MHFRSPSKATFAAFLLASTLFGQSYIVSNFAGALATQDGVPGTANYLRTPWGIASDSAGNIYFAESNSSRIRRITPVGVITTIAGTGTFGDTGDGGLAIDATIGTPSALTLDRPRSLLYFIDRSADKIRQVDLRTGIIRHVAGNGTLRFSGNGPDATKIAMAPAGIAVDATGILYVSDDFNERIYRITVTTGALETFAGTGTTGASGDGGPASLAQFDTPLDLVADANFLYINDYFNSRIRRINLQTREIGPFAGLGDFNSSGDGGPAARAGLTVVTGLGMDTNGNVYISDFASIRMVNRDGNISTVAGNRTRGFLGDGSAASSSRISIARGVAGLGANDFIIADTDNGRIRRVTAADGNITTIAGTDHRDNGPATNAFLNQPSGVFREKSGKTHLADSGNYRLRTVDSAGRITTFAGTGYDEFLTTSLGRTRGIVADSKGNIYFIDNAKHRLMEFQAGATAPRVYAGAANGVAGFAGDGASPIAARFSSPSGIAIDAQDNLYIADWGNNRVRKISADRVVSTVAGNGRTAFSGDGGAATSAGISPWDVAVDAQGNLIIADDLNNRVRRVTAADGRINTIAGNGTASTDGDGGPARDAGVLLPSSVAVDAQGNIYIGHRGLLRRVNTNGTIVRIGGTGSTSIDRDAGQATTVPMQPFDVQALDDGTLLVADSATGRIRLLTPQRAAALLISSGNNSVTPADQTTSVAVRVNDATGLPVVNEPVTFTVTTGQAKVSTPTVLTGPDGIAVATISFGGIIGPVGIRATAGTLAPVNFTISGVATAGPVTRISANGIAGAPLSGPPVRALSSNTIASVFGTNFAPTGTSRIVTSNDLVEGRIPTVFANTCVLVGGTRAPIYAVFANQINFQAPVVPATGDIDVRVVNGCDTPTAVTSDPERVAVRGATPEFFYFQQNVNGVNPVAAANALTGQPVGGAFTPVKGGDVVTIYGTGFGATNPGLAAGQIPDSIARVSGTSQVTLGTRVLPEANVLYVGIAPFNPGLYQVNIIVPDDAPDGDLPLLLRIGDQTSPAGAFLRVQNKGLSDVEDRKLDLLESQQQRVVPADPTAAAQAQLSRSRRTTRQ